MQRKTLYSLARFSARAALIWVALIFVAGLPTVASGQFRIMYNYGLERGDYKDFDLAEPRWELCRDACAGESACLAFTYTIPVAGANGRPAHCWLKNVVNRGEGRDWCISGIKEGGGGGGGPTLTGTWETTCCNGEIAWTLTLNMNQNGTFGGHFSEHSGGGNIENGRVNGSYLEFDRVGPGWRQHWSAQISNSDGKLHLINGIWTGDYQYRYEGRNNWRATKK